MTEIFYRLASSFEHSLVWYALVAGVFISLSASLLGVTLVLKRFSFIGDGLSHVAFGVMAMATAVNLSNNMFLVLPVTIICAVLLLRVGQNAKIKGDAAIAMISVGALAVGYLLMNLFSKSSNLAGDVCATLFGSTSFLTLSLANVWFCVALSLVVIAVFLIFYHKIFAITFDEEFSAATGVRAKTYNLVLAVIIAVVVVIAMNLVGTLLISALVIFPALSAMRVFKSFRNVSVCAVIIAVFCAIIGVLFSLIAKTPVGSSIVVVHIACFLAFSFTGYIARGSIAGLSKV